MNVYALQTARNGSESVPKKNILLRNDKPLYRYNFEAATNTFPVRGVFISTDIPEIIKEELPENVIKRPDYLCKNDSSHWETILHGMFEIESRRNERVDILIVLLGNNKGATPEDLGSAINYLRGHERVDSVMSMGEYNMFNPYRAYRGKRGSWVETLETILPQEMIKEKAIEGTHNNKNAFGQTLFFNGSFWVCRREAILNNDGLYPFTWLGKNIMPLVQNSRIMELDAPWQLELI